MKLKMALQKMEDIVARRGSVKGEIDTFFAEHFQSASIPLSYEAFEADINRIWAENGYSLWVILGEEIVEIISKHSVEDMAQEDGSPTLRGLVFAELITPQELRELLIKARYLDRVPDALLAFVWATLHIKS